MALVDGGDLVVRAIKHEGVDTIFTLSGGHVQKIYDGCLDEGIRVIDTRHEQVAGHAAEGYAGDAELRRRRRDRRAGRHRLHDGDRDRLPEQEPDARHRRRSPLRASRWARCRTWTTRR